jgi:hypothetical protein
MYQSFISHYPTCLLLLPLSAHSQGWEWRALVGRVISCPVPPPIRGLGVELELRLKIQLKQRYLTPTYDEP